MHCLAEPNVRQVYFTDFHPDPNAATKGGSLAGIFLVQRLNANAVYHASNRF
jgi:hypothetical protein